MRRILIISHGPLAKGALESLRIFTPTLENVEAISAYTEECPDPKPLVEEFFKKASSEDQIIVFSDIVFGSVNQLIFPYLKRESTYVFSGFNFPMLLQVIALSPDASEAEIRNLLSEGRQGIVYMNEYSFDQVEVEED